MFFFSKKKLETIDSIITKASSREVTKSGSVSSENISITSIQICEKRKKKIIKKKK